MSRPRDAVLASIFGDLADAPARLGAFIEGLGVGTRFAVYRDLQLAQNPLKRIGEAVAVSVGPSLTVVRITSARDAVFSGLTFAAIFLNVRFARLTSRGHP